MWLPLARSGFPVGRIHPFAWTSSEKFAPADVSGARWRPEVIPTQPLARCALTIVTSTHTCALTTERDLATESSRHQPGPRPASALCAREVDCLGGGPTRVKFLNLELTEKFFNLGVDYGCKNNLQ